LLLWFARRLSRLRCFVRLAAPCAAAFLFQRDRQIDDAAVHHWHAEREAVKLDRLLRDDEADRLRRAGAG
jgi:hypothetical protein